MRCCTIARWVHFLSILNEKTSFELSISFACNWLLRVFALRIFSNIASSFAHWLVKLTYLWKNLTKSWAMILSSSYACSVSKFCFPTSVVLHDVKGCIDVVPCMTRKSHEVLCCVRNLRRSSAHFMLYFPVVCYEIHVKLIHISARWIETITYRVTLNEVLSCSSLIHVSCLNSVEMSEWLISRKFWSCLHVLDLTSSYVSIWTRCLDSWSMSRFRLIVALHVRIYLTRCLDKRFISRNFWLCSVFRLLCTCSNSVEMLAMTYLAIYDLLACSNRARCSMNHLARLLIWSAYVLRCFSSKCSIKSCLARVTFSSYKTYWTYKQLHARLLTSSSLCQCECDLSKIVNFWLT